MAEDQDQFFLLPPSLMEWLPEDDLAFFVMDAVEEMDLSGFYAGYRADGWGGAARHPKTMVALLLYAYCTGVVSSRKIERACYVDVAFRVVCANLPPDHTTIARFRARHEQALKSLFTASLRLCARAGMTSVGLVALDGTKMAAPASLARNRSKDSLDRAVEELFAAAEAADAAEDAQHGVDRGDEPPAVLRGRADRRRRFKAAKQKLDAELEAQLKAHEDHLAARAAAEAERGSKLRGRKPKAPQERARHKPKKVNTTDPESGVMSTANGFVQGYNAQAAANEEQVVLSAEVTDEHNDCTQLHPMITATHASLGAAGIAERPEKLLADAGYASEENFAALGEQDPDCYIATRNMKKNPAPRTGRRGPLKKDATLLERMDRKVSTKNGNAIYRHRQRIIEPVFGQIKGARGIRRFSRRGKAAADAEWKLICGTHNLLKLYRRVLTDPTLAPYSRIGAAAAA
ncbi:transposase [Intrasporangium chromatireducens]|uniref:transposase n=1 Tax=Intrasporangium chromatireducens TaxID=1386088 RepID=UPI00196A0B73|nr:transposase [Intrasporangium chromatireducens]